MSNPISEYLVYLHGISVENYATKNDGNGHTPDYDKLHQGIEAALKRHNAQSQQAWEGAIRCNVEWGWDNSQKPDPSGHLLLAQAQDKLADRILPQVEKDYNQILTWILKLTSKWVPSVQQVLQGRKLMLKGFSDMFYYTSGGGKNSVRAAVAAQILNCIHQPLENSEPISLTFFGHSAGSVIAFDFLFYLFAPPETLEKYDTEDGQEHGHKHEFIHAENETEGKILKDFEKLRQLAQNHKLRVRQLVTFGSPISMLAFRNNKVLRILPQGEKLNPSDYGLDQNPPIFGASLSELRWINFWDKDDIISWPIEPLMEKSSYVKDEEVNVGNLFDAHNSYWDDENVHEKIATLW